eukprot:5110056-Prymnesium_polylepis.1
MTFRIAKTFTPYHHPFEVYELFIELSAFFTTNVRAALLLPGRNRRNGPARGARTPKRTPTCRRLDVAWLRRRRPSSQASSTRTPRALRTTWRSLNGLTCSNSTEWSGYRARGYNPDSHGDHHLENARVTCTIVDRLQEALNNRGAISAGAVLAYVRCLVPSSPAACSSGDGPTWPTARRSPLAGLHRARPAVRPAIDRLDPDDNLRVHLRPRLPRGVRPLLVRAVELRDRLLPRPEAAAQPHLGAHHAPGDGEAAAREPREEGLRGGHEQRSQWRRPLEERGAREQHGGRGRAATVEEHGGGRDTEAADKPARDENGGSRPAEESADGNESADESAEESAEE